MSVDTVVALRQVRRKGDAALCSVSERDNNETSVLCPPNAAQSLLLYRAMRVTMSVEESVKMLTFAFWSVVRVCCFEPNWASCGLLNTPCPLFWLHASNLTEPNSSLALRPHVSEFSLPGTGFGFGFVRSAAGRNLIQFDGEIIRAFATPLATSRAKAQNMAKPVHLVPFPTPSPTQTHFTPHVR